VARTYARFRTRIPAPTRLPPALAAGLLLVPFANIAMAVYLALDLPRAIRRSLGTDREGVETEPLALLLLAAPVVAVALTVALGLPLILTGYLTWPFELPALLLSQRALNRLGEERDQTTLPIGGDRLIDGEVLASVLLAIVIGAGAAIALVAGDDEDKKQTTPSFAKIPQVSDIAISPGSLWVTHVDDGKVARLDPRTGKAAGRPIPVGRSPLDVASGYRSIWVTNYVSSTVSRLDWTSGQADAPPISVGRGPFGIAVGEGSVWVANQVERNVVQIDPNTNRVRRRFTIGRAPRGIAVGEGAVWAAASEGRAVYRIDPESGDTKKIPVRRFCQDVAAGGGGVWATLPEQNQVLHIDPATQRIVGPPIGVGLGPSTVEYGDGFVWVANSAEGTVTRIDPHTSKTVGKPTSVGKGISDLTVRGNQVWVLRTDGVVKRIEIGAPPAGGGTP
jgi:streptogramin lyase